MKRPESNMALEDRGQPSMRRSGQSGFTLVEIMVSLVLGLLVLGAVLSMFVATRQTERTRQALGEVQENGRFALWMLGSAIQNAGYTQATTADQVTPALTGTSTPENITVSFQSSADLRDCEGRDLGQRTAAGLPSLVSDTYGISVEGLVCNGGPEALVEGAEAIRVHYGVDMTGDGIVNVWVMGDDINAAGGTVLGARLAVLIRSRDNVASEEDDKAYDLLDSRYDPPNDHRLRRSFMTTLMLRNRGS